MVRGTLVVMALMVALASVQALGLFTRRDPNNVARAWLRARLEEEDHKAEDRSSSSSHYSRSSARSQHSNQRSSESADIASSIAHQISRSEQGSVPVPYTKKFYLTFGPYYVENPLSEVRKGLRQMDEIDNGGMSALNNGR